MNPIAPMPSVCISLVYVLAGFGLHAGFPSWNSFVKGLYAFLFPLHALVFSLLRPTGSVLGKLWEYLMTKGKFLE